MYEAYCTYVDDKYLDNHDYDDDTDADTDNDTGDDTDDDINTHIIVWSVNYNEWLLYALEINIVEQESMWLWKATSQRRQQFPSYH